MPSKKDDDKDKQPAENPERPNAGAAADVDPGDTPIGTDARGDAYPLADQPDEQAPADEAGAPAQRDPLLSEDAQQPGESYEHFMARQRPAGG